MQSKKVLPVLAAAILLPGDGEACVLVPPAPEVPRAIQERMKAMGLARPKGVETGPQGCKPGDRMHTRGVLPVRQMLRITTEYCDFQKEVVTVASGLNVRGKRLVGLACVYRPSKP